jgi:hypothetical protein
MQLGAGRCRSGLPSKDFDTISKDWRQNRSLASMMMFVCLAVHAAPFANVAFEAR